MAMEELNSKMVPSMKEASAKDILMVKEQLFGKTEEALKDIG